MSESVSRSHADWKGLIEEQASSGETITGFCESRSLAQHSFYYHKRRLREAVGGFRELKACGGSGVRVIVSGNYRVEVDRVFDAPCLRSVVQALQ